MWWKSNHMSSPCCKFAFSSPSVASQSTSAIPDKFKCTNLVFCWFFSLTILSWCRFVNRRFGLYINTACGIFFSNFKNLATMTKIRPAVQISLESLYHHVKLFSQFSGKICSDKYWASANIGRERERREKRDKLYLLIWVCWEKRWTWKWEMRWNPEWNYKLKWNLQCKE